MKNRSIAVLVLVMAVALCAYPALRSQAQDKVMPHEQPSGEDGTLGATVYHTFNNPGYAYVPIHIPPAGVYYSAVGFNPDGTKIMAQKRWTDTVTRREIVLMDADGSNETVISVGDSGTGDIYGYLNPFWSDDGTAVGFLEVHNANPNKVIVYDIASSSQSYIYEPSTPNDVSNPDFLGSSKTSIVFWAYGDVGGADLWTWDGTTLTNITDTDEYKEYEPVSNADGTVIVYWSGESTAEPTNTTHTLTYSGGTWSKDVGFSPIVGSFWSYWTTPVATQIATSMWADSSGVVDVYLYDSTGAYVDDLTGSGYTGGTGQWSYFGNMPKGSPGAFAISTNAGRGGTLGRDLILAVPVCTTDCYVDAATGDDSFPGSSDWPMKTIQKGVNTVASGGTVHVAAGLYNESVTVSRSMTLLGAQADVNPVDGGRPGGESKISSQYAVKIYGSDVVLNGFEIADFRYGVDVDYDAYGYPPPSYSLSDITISYNWIHAQDAWVGFTTSPGLLQNLLITHNIIDVSNVTPGGDAYALAAIGMSGGNSLDGHPTYENIVISNNDLRNLSPDGGYTLFSGANPASYLVNGMTITGNRFRNVQVVGANLNLGNILNGTFTNNIVEDVGGSIGIDSGTISGNTFRNGGFLALWGTEYGFTRPSRNLTVTNNDFTDELYGRGLRMRTGVDPSTVAVHDNAFRDSGIAPGGGLFGPPWDGYVLINQETGTLDATDNWWGSAAGPAGNTGGVYGPATTTPWISGYMDDPAKQVPPTEWPLSAESNQPGFWPLPLCTTDCYVNAATGSDSNDGSLAYPFLTIQKGVDTVSAGGTVHVANGTYEEQVVVTAKNLTLQGASTAAVIKAPASIPICFTTSAANKPVVCIKDGATVTLDKFTIDGAGRGNANDKFEGVAFRNASGTLKNSVVKDIRDTPFSGAQHGVAIYVYNDDLTGRTVNVWDNEVYGFQKNAMALNAGDTTPLTVDVRRNVVTGAGPTTVTAQNGIQVWAVLGTGTVDGNTVSGIAYDNTTNPTKYVATSILPYYSDLTITNNSITGSHMGIYNIEGSAVIQYNNLTINKVGVSAYGVVATDPEDAVPAPYDEGMGGPGGHPAAKPEAILTVNTSGNTVTFSGLDNTSTYGIEADAGYGPDDIALTANGNTITGFEVGLELWKCTSGCDTGVFTSITAHDNCFSGNTYGMRSNAEYITADGTGNWWGAASGPYHPTKNAGGTGDDVSAYIDFEPWVTDGCGGHTTTGHWKNLRTGAYDDLASSLAAAITGDTIQGVCSGPSPAIPGGGTATVSGVTVDLHGCTAGPGSPFLVVNADDITVVGPGKIDGGGGGGGGIIVNAGADNFILESAQVTGWANAVELLGDVTSFKVVSNWIHTNTGHGLYIAPGVDLLGVVTIEGNLFKVNGGNGIQHDGNGTLPAEYNSWGDIGGYGPGDGKAGDVDADPFTYIESFFDVYPDTLALERHVPEETSFHVALKADAVNVYGLTFKFTYDLDALALNSATFAGPWAASDRCVPWPDPNPAGVVSYICQLYAGDAEWTETAGTIATFNFTALELLDDGPLTTYLNISPLELDTSASAIGGQKIFVNNAGFNLPSASERDITDTDDGRIIVERLASYTGFIDLQGRTNDSGALLEVHATATYGSTLLAQATSASSGAYTTAPITPYWLGIGNTYWFQVNRALYLPTTVLYPAPAGAYAQSKLLSAPLTSLAKVVLLGGDATNNDEVGLGDLACIGGNYGGSGLVCGTTGWSDVNGDGKVNVQDLSMAGGNLYKTSSPWIP